VPRQVGRLNASQQLDLTKWFRNFCIAFVILASMASAYWVTLCVNPHWFWNKWQVDGQGTVLRYWTSAGR
jgi:hypothetical protein